MSGTRLSALAARVQLAPFELVFALLLVLSGVRFLWKEDELEASQIGQTLPLPQLWAAGYLAAGVLVFAGVLGARSRIEAAGLSVMASVVTINAIAFAYAYDIWAEWAFGVAFVFYLGLAIACLARIRVLVRGPVVILQAPAARIVAEDPDGR